jgi:hypothetical protein
MIACREHPWQEKAAGRDSARPVDASLDPRPPPYHAHHAATQIKQALHRATEGRAHDE